MRKVLLYSGGMDSYCLAKVENPDVLLHVGMGSQYAQAEGSHLTVPSGCVGKLIREYLPLGQFERQDYVIPARNAFLVLMAAQYGDDILLGANAADRNTDKDETFAEKITDLMQYIWQPSKWNADGDTKQVRLPMRHLTKRQIVQAYLDAGGDELELQRDSFSCYSPDSRGEECGMCRACAKKWLALAGCGIDPIIYARDYAYENYYKPAIDNNWTMGEQYRLDVIEAIERTERV